MIALIYSDGSISPTDLKKECQNQKWIPLAVVKDKVEQIFVICFNSQDIARKFSKRNFPKNWIQGSIKLSDADLNFIDKKKWKIKILDFPRLLNSHPEYTLSFEILDFYEEPELFYTR